MIRALLLGSGTPSPPCLFTSSLRVRVLVTAYEDTNQDPGPQIRLRFEVLGLGPRRAGSGGSAPSLTGCDCYPSPCPTLTPSFQRPIGILGVPTLAGERSEDPSARAQAVLGGVTPPQPRAPELGL